MIRPARFQPARFQASDVSPSSVLVQDGEVTIQFVGSEAYDITYFNIRRGLVGGRLSRAWASIVQGGARYVVSFRHEGSAANAVTWNPGLLAGASHAFADLADGDVTAAAVASAWATEMTGLGVQGVSTDGDTVTVANASGFLTGAGFDIDENTRGIWGKQRAVFTSADADGFTSLNATSSVHVVAPATAGRIIGVYGRVTGTVRMGVASGPAHSATPATFTNGAEALATAGPG